MHQLKLCSRGEGMGDPGGFDLYIQPMAGELDLTFTARGGGGAGIRQIRFLCHKLNKGEHKPKKHTFKEKFEFTHGGIRQCFVTLRGEIREQIFPKV